MFMTNLCKVREGIYKHHWDDIKKIVMTNKRSIALVSIEKEDKRKHLRKEIPIDRIRLRKSTRYYTPWDIARIDYWIHSNKTEIKKGNLWRKS